MKLQVLRPREAYGVWQRWWAWRPVLINGKLIWMEWVERQRHGYGSEAPPYWEYRFPE